MLPLSNSESWLDAVDLAFATEFAPNQSVRQSTSSRKEVFYASADDVPSGLKVGTTPDFLLFSSHMTYRAVWNWPMNAGA
ncbi:hypothetical protein N7468_007979 [Penicillium chermesinum]|uniref:Uncharacterized protein n=1 Tax=Penicillium chermesinum TaxID=63820 RepID=A0A9W9NNY0_9EURO|nr:uncharacterized protein N7468_007979 [Penicillium chermesinum]KAJ5223437.1 hypothetical protein N7468_007979 [Penicillium chermesinum]